MVFHIRLKHRDIHLPVGQSIGHNEIQIFKYQKYFTFLTYTFDSLEISVELTHINGRYIIIDIISH